MHFIKKLFSHKVTVKHRPTLNVVSRYIFLRMGLGTPKKTYNSKGSVRRHSLILK